ncbi:MAG: YgaP family membrane protein [Planctomycetota bacterium]
MSVERWLRGAAGFYVLLGASPAHYHLRYRLSFTGFVGLNLAQSGLTNRCPMMSILRKPGVESRSRKGKEESEV